MAKLVGRSLARWGGLSPSLVYFYFAKAAAPSIYPVRSFVGRLLGWFAEKAKTGSVLPPPSLARALSSSLKSNVLSAFYS